MGIPDLWQDVRLALRGFSRTPLFTATAVLSMALGIGANTGIFALMDRVLLRLLPVRNPEELVLVCSRGEHYGSNNGDNRLSYPMYKDYRDRAEAFNGVICRYPYTFHLSHDGRTERISGELVSGNYFSVLGVGAAMGRLLTPADDEKAGGSAVAVISYTFWKTRFNGDPRILGQTIRLNDHQFVIVGVSQDGFDGITPGVSQSVRIPVTEYARLNTDSKNLTDRRQRWVQTYARLKPGWTVERAKASLQPMFHSMLEAEIQEEAFRNATPFVKSKFLEMRAEALPAASGQTNTQRQARQPMTILMATVALVLLIACANVANLLIARGTMRQKEMAIRISLGASRGRVISQLLVESILLALMGGVAGLLLGSFTLTAMLGMVKQAFPGLVFDASLDGRMLLFNFAVALATGLIFGMAPALQTTKPEVTPVLKQTTGGVVGSGSAKLRKSLAVLQMALSLLLLVASGLFLQSLRNLRNVNPGFKAENLIAFDLDPSNSGYQKDRIKLLYKDALARLSQLPGISTTSYANVGVMEGGEWDSSVTLEGYQAKDGEDMGPHCNAVSPGYFKTMGIALLSGRDFDGRDEIIGKNDRKWAENYTKVIVNQSFAKRYYGEGSPLGRHLGFGIDPGTKTPMEIVGVVADAKYEGLRNETPRTLYFPYMENAYPGGVVFYVRTERDSASTFQGIRQVLTQLAPDVPLHDLRMMEDQLDRTLVLERMVARLSMAFGVLSTLLAIVGLYGVMAFTVSRRTREFGIRMALGADSARVVKMVMREVLMLIGLGIAIALPTAWALSRYVESVLYGVKGRDPVTLGLATLMLALVAGASGFIPALRASRVAPSSALRYE